MKKVHSLGQKPQAAVGSKRAMTTEENRFTALLSRIGFPAMYFTSFAGLLTTMPVLSSKPVNCIVAPKYESTTDPSNPARPPNAIIGHWGAECLNH